MTIHLKWILAIFCYCFSIVFVIAQDVQPNENQPQSTNNTATDSIPTAPSTKSSKDSKMKGNTMPNNNANANAENPVKDKVIVIDSLGKGDKASDKNQASVVAQKKAKTHSPKTAALLALIPGAGQIYNGKYWKLPIVYGGIGGLGYWGISSYSEYKKYKKAYNAAADDDPATNYVHPKNPNASARELQLQKNFYRGQYEYGLIFGVLFYGLTIADAFVDAHLRTFDISDNLSMKIAPKVEVLPSWATLQTQTNMSLSLKFTPRTKKDIKTAIAHW